MRRLDGNHLDGPSGRLQHGMHSIATHLAERLPDRTIRLGTPATSITADGELLVVSTHDASVTAPDVVLAIPPALATRTIDLVGLEPHVASVAAATPVWMGSTVKIVVQYSTPFWRANGLAGAGFSHVGPLREIHDMSGPDGRPAALFGFASPGPNGPAPDRDAVVRQLVTMFGPEAAEPVALHVADWRTEAFTSPADVHDLTDYRTYGHSAYQQPSMGGRLHWAATETSVITPG
ncbi:MAG: FAD-dependent oxidoreductase, partial [Myxococcota bacterium]